MTDFSAYRKIGMEQSPFRRGDPYEIRTRDAAVKGRSLNRLTNGPFLLFLKTRVAVSLFDKTVPSFV